MPDMRVLFASDGSAGSDQALRLIASSFDPRRVKSVEILSVVPRAPGGLEADRGVAPSIALEEVYRDQAEQSVRAASEVLRAGGFETIETVRSGHAADTIVTHATTSRADLIVLGTRGLGGLRRRISGSVSGKVARYAQCSVLVARTHGPIRSVLLGYDGSPDANAALELLARLPLRVNQVAVCTAYDVVKPLTSGIAPTMHGAVRAAYEESLRLARESAEASAAHGAALLRERGITATHRTSAGPARTRLAIIATETAVDLVVVGSRGLSGISRFFLGSTSAALVTQPPTNILVARSVGD